MKLTRRIKCRLHPSVVNGFTAIRSVYYPSGYYRNRKIEDPFRNFKIFRIETFRIMESRFVPTQVRST